MNTISSKDTVDGTVARDLIVNTAQTLGKLSHREAVRLGQQVFSAFGLDWSCETVPRIALTEATARAAIDISKNVAGAEAVRPEIIDGIAANRRLGSLEARQRGWVYLAKTPNLTAGDIDAIMDAACSHNNERGRIEVAQTLLDRTRSVSHGAKLISRMGSGATSDDPMTLGRHKLVAIECLILRFELSRQDWQVLDELGARLTLLELKEQYATLRRNAQRRAGGDA